MRIVLDLQGAQGKSRFRGIGRYTLSLALAIAQNRGDHEIIIVLNGLFTETIQPIQAAFHGILSKESFRIWIMPKFVQYCQKIPGTWGQKRAEQSYEQFIMDLSPDIVHISSLFEHYKSGAITSIGIIAQKTPIIVTFYDLIPFLNMQHYFKLKPKRKQYYLHKIEHLKRATAWLTISRFSVEEAKTVLNLHQKKFFNISAGSSFRHKKISKEEINKTLQLFDLKKPFLMYSSSTDKRKNHFRLISAYSELPQFLRNQYQLLLVGNISKKRKAQFMAHIRFCELTDHEVIITGHISDETMAILYQICHLFVFPSLSEGFGLPILEAMCCGAPVIGSNTSSIPEIIGRTDSLFNPHDEKDISQKIMEVLNDETFRQTLIGHSLQQAKLFSWDKSAKVAISACEQLHAYKNNPTLL
ncbi:MAG: glycosyltransferase family 1 protein [Legionellaceae bacterium]|nr:glycosyltransferase family 1 protein [Legionellaceae bacterium]